MSKTVRAKFIVNKVDETEINQYKGTEIIGKEKAYSISLSPVTSGSKENDEFYKYTPGGSLTLTTVNAKAGEQFEAGKHYYVDITEAPQDPTEVVDDQAEADAKAEAAAS